MIELRITEKEIEAHNRENGLRAVRPNSIRHPRFVFKEGDETALILRTLLREVRGGWKLLKPKVSVSVEFPLDGGPTGLDFRQIQWMLCEAGARQVKIHWKDGNLA